MTDDELRTLAHRLRSELTDVVSDDEDRARIAAELDGALAGTDTDTVIDALTSSPATQQWYKSKIGRDVHRFQGLPGSPATNIYYVCPEGDRDKVLPAVPEEPPRCPTHGVAMIAS